MVVMSLPRDKALVAARKHLCGSKEKEFGGLAVGDLLVGKALYRSAAAQALWGPNNIKLAKELNFSLTHAYKCTNTHKDELSLHAPILSVRSSQHR